MLPYGTDSHRVVASFNNEGKQANEWEQKPSIRVYTGLSCYDSANLAEGPQ